MDVLDEFFARHPEKIGWVSDKQAITMLLMDKELEINALIIRVSNKFMKWSMAKDHFISEETRYLLDLHHKKLAGEMSETEIIHAMDNEMASLRTQDEAMSAKDVRQVIMVKPVAVTDVGEKEKNIDLFIAGVGFISGGLQVVAGVGLVETGFGGLMIAHGVNNVIENGYYFLYRQSYTGPLKFVYEGVGELFGINKQDSDVIYTFVDIALSVNGLLGCKLAEDTARLYRYVTADLLWGIKEIGYKKISADELIVELIGDINTVAGQYRAYQ
jgi:hypothetical protein